MVRVASAKASLRMVTNLPRISVSCCLCLMHQSFADGLQSWHADSATQMLCDVEMKSPWLTHLSAQMHACKSKRSGRTQSQHILKLSQRRFHGCLAQVGAFRKLVILEHLVLRFEELPGTLRLDTTQLQGLHQGQNWLMLLLGQCRSVKVSTKMDSNSYAITAPTLHGKFLSWPEARTTSGQACSARGARDSSSSSWSRPLFA